MSQSLAIKYRPKSFEDVVEQDNIKVILQNQLNQNEIQHSYLFCGPAGDGKTTTARILANAINHGEGNPIELDAASNNSVDDMRELIQQAQTKSLNSEYKVFIIDECHMITVAGWNAILKLIEEPPAKSIFIFCTTDPQKIPKTILSRVQRYTFKLISQQAIVNRLNYILDNEWSEHPDWDAMTESDALAYIAKLADGHMRDAITFLEKCLGYSKDITLDNAVEVLDTVGYDEMFTLIARLLAGESRLAIELVESIHDEGRDMKQFLKQFTHFLLDVRKYAVGCNWEYINIPKTDKYVKFLEDGDKYIDCADVLKMCVKLNSEIKYSENPKLDIETAFMIYCGR